MLGVGSCCVGGGVVLCWGWGRAVLGVGSCCVGGVALCWGWGRAVLGVGSRCARGGVALNSGGVVTREIQI